MSALLGRFLNGRPWLLATTALAPTNPTSPSTPTVTPPTTPATGSATRYDVVLDQSVVAPGATVTGKLYPNGLWAGGQVVVTPQAGSAVTVSLPSSGSAAVSFSFPAPSIGDDVFTPTNTAGLYNPWPVQVNVFAASSGTARTLTASLAGSAPDMRTYQRDAAAGTPAGFPSSFNRGWGQVAINVAFLSGATDGVWVRLYDALSNGASTAAGTGTALHQSPVQVHGALGAAGMITPLLPASASVYYVDIATDAAFTNPVRIAQRCRVGVVVAQFSRSQESGLTRSYNDDATAYSAIYTKTASWVATDHRYAAGAYNNAYWCLQDHASRNSFTGELSSSGAEEFGRLLEAQLGVCVGITGLAEAGGDFDTFVAHDGSLCAGFTGTVAESCGGKFRYFWANTTGWAGVDSAYPTETHAEVRTRYRAAVDFIARTYPACAVIGWNTGASGGFGSDGSRAVGYTRNQAIFLNEIEPSNPMVVSKDSHLWAEFVGSHASMAARKDYVRPGYRHLMAAELTAMGGFQSADRGPLLGSQATITGRVISIPYTVATGANLVAVGVTYSDPNATYGTATPAEIASLFSVYLPGQFSQAGTAIRIDTAAINASAKTIDLTLTGSTGVTFADGTTGAIPATLSVCYAADFTASNASVPLYGGRGVMLADDRTGQGIPYGWHMRPALDIPAVTVVPLFNRYTVTNTSSASTPGFYKRGAAFRKGDVPAGSIPALSAGTGQFYGLTYWSDGSLKTARQLVRDTAFGASEARTVTLTAASGSTPAGATATIGNAGLVSALTGHDIRVVFRNVTSQADNSAYGSGSLDAVLATHATKGTRWTRLTTGAVADVWQGWGMAVNAATSAEDAHLKVNWYVTRWKNADGSTAGLQVAAVVTMDWWSVADKTNLSYDAALVDGATTTVSYAAVKHYYHSQWLLCSASDGTVPWSSAATPTLFTVGDKPYLVATNLVPPYDLTKSPTPGPLFTYVPGAIVDGADTHRYAIDAVGNYSGRGPVTRFDSDAFMGGSRQAYTLARLNALVGLSVPYHHRSNRIRTRPGEAADIASTNIPLLMAPKAASASDFTAIGLPAAANAYRSGPQTDGFVAPPSSGPWALSDNASHAVSYCYFTALVSGDEWWDEATLDLAMNLAHQGIYGYHNFAQSFAVPYNPACPTDYWTGLLGQFHPDNMRYVGWSQLIQGHAFGRLPADHQFYPAAKALAAHNGDYIALNLDNLPADFAAAASYLPNSQLGQESLFSPWMAGLGAVGAYSNYLQTEEPRSKRLGDYIAKWSVTQAQAGRWYMLEAYRTNVRAACAVWNATTNPQLPVLQQGYMELTPDLVGSSGTFTQNQANQWQVNGCSPPPLRNGDVVYFTRQTDGTNNGTLPNGVAEGTKGYVINVTAGGKLTGRNPPSPAVTFQVSSTPGGSPMTFSANASGYNFATGTPGLILATVPQAAGDYAVATAGADFLSWPYLPDWGNYTPIHLTVLALARLAGNTAVTPALRDAANAFRGPMKDYSGPYWSSFDCVATT